MFIVPMNGSIDTSKVKAMTDSSDTEASGAGGFKQVFTDLIDNVEQSEKIAEEDAYKLSIGELDDPHTAVINAAKAEMTLMTMVQVRNKVLEAYTEIMRINV